MGPDPEEAFRLFLLTGLPQAYTYSRAARRERAGRRPEEREDEPRRT